MHSDATKGELPAYIDAWIPFDELALFARGT